MCDVFATAVRPANLQRVRTECRRHDVHYGTHAGMATDLGRVVEHAKAVERRAELG